MVAFLFCFFFYYFLCWFIGPKAATSVSCFIGSVFFITFCISKPAIIILIIFFILFLVVLASSNIKELNNELEEIKLNIAIFQDNISNYDILNNFINMNKKSIESLVFGVDSMDTLKKGVLKIVCEEFDLKFNNYFQEEFNYYYSTKDTSNSKILDEFVLMVRVLIENEVIPENNNFGLYLLSTWITFFTEVNEIIYDDLIFENPLLERLNKLNYNNLNDCVSSYYELTYTKTIPNDKIRFFHLLMYNDMFDLPLHRSGECWKIFEPIFKDVGKEFYEEFRYKKYKENLTNYNK